MERKNKASVFESDNKEEIVRLQQKLNELQIPSDVEKQDIENEESNIFHLIVSLKDEAKAFECIDEYLNSTPT